MLLVRCLWLFQDEQCRLIFIIEIENISNYREPQPGFEAMYLLMPTTQNVERIIREFRGPELQYAGAHLFFIEGACCSRFIRDLPGSFQSRPGGTLVSRVGKLACKGSLADTTRALSKL